MASSPYVVSFWQTLVLGICAMQIGPSLAIAAGYQLHLSGRLSWLVIAAAAVISTLVATAIALFARQVVATGSVLSYVRLVLPHWAVSLTGAALVLGYVLGPASNVMGSAMYFASILIELGMPAAGAPMSVCAIVLLIAGFAGFCAYRGVELSAKVALVLGIVCIPVAIGITIAAAASYGFDVRPELSLRHVSWIDIGRGMFVAFGFFVGFDGVTSVASETAAPRRDVPRVLYWSLCLTGVIVAIGALFQTPVLLSQVAAIDAGESPTAILARAGGISSLNLAADLLLCLATLAGLIGWLNFAATIVATAGKDGFLLRGLGGTHPRYGSPYKAVIFLSIVSAVISIVLEMIARTPAIVSLLYLTNMLVLLWLIPYILVCCAAMIFERRHGRTRSATFLASAVGALGMSVTLGIHLVWSPDAVARTTEWLTLALVVVGFCVLYKAGPARQALVSVDGPP